MQALGPCTRLALALVMSRPRQVLPGTIYLVTRRCARREFLLRPSTITNGIIRYVLALAALRTGVVINAFCVMSNHLHIVLTDTYANLPAFMQYVNSLVGRAVNLSLGREESFWAPNTYSAVALQTPEDVIDKVAYVLANPVAAGLVPRGRDWPGLWSDPESIGGDAVDAARPTVFFDPDGPMPACVQLRLRRPEGFASAQEFDSRLREALGRLEEQAAHDLRAEKRSFLGVRGVMAQAPFERATSREPRCALKPRIACRDKWKRIEALSRLAAFLEDYRAALAAWRRGLRDVLFPAGTYHLCRLHGARCAAPT